MASVTEQLIMRITLIDAVTRPLEGINNQLSRVKNTAKSAFANIADGGTSIQAGGMAIQNALMPAIEMDRALGKVASLGIAQSGLKALSDEALKFSVEYGKSATEFVRASYSIRSAIGGLSESEFPAFTRASAVLAAATKADTGTITNYMGTMYGIFEQQARQMGKANWVEDVAGKTAAAVQMFKTTGQGMADAFGAIGANATTAGISMDEQFAVLGQLQATMSGGEAGTTFKAFLAGVGNAQKALGIQFTDTAGGMLPVLTMLDKLKARYGETLSEAEGDELKKAFGSDKAVNMIKLLMSNTNGLATNINALANTHGMGKAEQMAAAMTDQWQRVEQAWFAIRAAAFGLVLPAINTVVSVFADVANDVLRWTHLFPNLTKVISYALLAIIGLSMATGTWMLIAGLAKLTTLGLGIAWAIITAPLALINAGMATFRAILLAVNIAMYANPVGLIVAGIVLLIGAVAAAIYYWDDLKKSMADWSVFKLLGQAVDWLIDKLNMIPGVNIEMGGMPELNLPNQENINAPLARFSQGNQSRVPAGGLGQQLIQANAAATSANQKPSRSLTTGDVYMNVQNPLLPGELEQELWMTTRG